jgi:hypothetical protein
MGTFCHSGTEGDAADGLGIFPPGLSDWMTTTGQFEVTIYVLRILPDPTSLACET